MRTLSYFYLATLLCGGNVLAAEADKLLIEVIQKEPPNSVQGLPRPTSGMTQTEVREAFGTPVTSVGPVGKPPITRWEFEQFVVIFEDDRVIRAVPKFKPTNTAPAVAAQE